MKTFTTFFLALLLLAFSPTHLSAQARQYRILLIDDVAWPDYGQKFEQAFVLDATCNGLVLMRASTSKSEDQINIREAHGFWMVSFLPLAATFGRVQYAMNVTLMVYKNGGLYPSADVHLSSTSAQDAIHRACAVAKHSGQ